MIKTLTNIALALAAIAAAPVCAQDAAVREAKVQYADLDIASAAGRATLDTRIRGAARIVCGQAPARDLVDINHHRRCIRGALAGASGEVEKVLASRATGTVLAVRR